MIKKYISKFTIDILPSIVATIVGAYIVNHYIIPKNDAGKPAAALASVPDNATAPAKPADARAAVIRPLENSASFATVPDAASGKPKSSDKPVEKTNVDKPETASVPDSRRHTPTRDKAVAKATPAPVTSVPTTAAAVTPAVVAPALATVGTALADTSSAEERRDANDLARAAIERLGRSEPRSTEASRTPDAPRVQETPRVPDSRLQDVVRTVPAQPMQQLPPPIVVATPSVEKFEPQLQAERSDSRRMRPPGEIPAPLPVDLQADATGSSRPPRTNVAEDVLSAAKSVFNSVIPHPFDR